MKYLIITAGLNKSKYSKFEQIFKKTCEVSHKYIFEKNLSLNIKPEFIDISEINYFLSDERINEYTFIIGPAQSKNVGILLEKVKNLNLTIPIFSPSATSSSLEKYCLDNNIKSFYRTTSTDKERIVYLIDNVLKKFENKNFVYIYNQELSKDSIPEYETGLYKDFMQVKSVLEGKKKLIGLSFYELDSEIRIEKMDSIPKNSIILLLCGSNSAANIAKKFRSTLVGSTCSFFVFGDNPNLLNIYLWEAVTITDNTNIVTENLENEFNKELASIEDYYSSVVLSYLIIEGVLILLRDNKLELSWENINSNIYELEEVGKSISIVKKQKRFYIGINDKNFLTIRFKFLGWPMRFYFDEYVFNSISMKKSKGQPVVLYPFMFILKYLRYFFDLLRILNPFD